MHQEPYELKPLKYSSHYWILRKMAAAKAPLRILDVGTATGYLGARLRNRGNYVAGIESQTEWAETARRHYDTFQLADIEEHDFPNRQEFDYILFADVLEHLRDPVAVLRRFIPALKGSGKILISVPNVAHLIIRLSLLAGRFDYVDRGILDKTHLRFFTLRSLKQMMQEVSCKVIDIAPTPVPVQIVFPITARKLFDPFHEAHYAFVRSWKTLLAYQFVVTAVPNVGDSAATGGNI